MATTVEGFRLRYPEFADLTEYSDARVQMFLDDSQLAMGDDEDYWCGYYDVAQYALSAHLLTIATGGEYGDTSAKAGPITGKAAGGVSVARGNSSGNVRSDADDMLSTTIYGQRYLFYRNRCIVGAMVVC